MEYTKNYSLKKPSQMDYYDVDDFNYNADIVDDILGQMPEFYYDSDYKAMELRGGVVSGGDSGDEGEGDISKPLTAATSDRLGGVKIGEGINVTKDGKISLNMETITEIIMKSLAEISPEELEAIFRK